VRTAVSGNRYWKSRPNRERNRARSHENTDRDSLKKPPGHASAIARGPARLRPSRPWIGWVVAQNGRLYGCAKRSLPPSGEVARWGKQERQPTESQWRLSNGCCSGSTIDWSGRNSQYRLGVKSDARSPSILRGRALWLSSTGSVRGGTPSGE
jgi:hypothetical protein